MSAADDPNRVLREERDRLRAELADVKNALKITNRSADDQMRYKREAESALAASRARCAKLRKRVKELEDEWPLEILRISSYEKRRL